MSNDLPNLKCLSGSTLKAIAVISMTIDHVALYVMAGHLDKQDLWPYDVLREVGRLAFPVFAFLVVEGYHHTRNLKRYVMNLLLTALVSEIPWYLLGQYDSHNVLFTLLLGLVGVILTDRISKKSWLLSVPSFIIGLIATWINTDYSWHGIGLMVVFYLFRDKKFLIFPFGLPFLLEYGIIGTSMGIIACLCYNGSRGFVRGKWPKSFFYIYYPLHLTIILLGFKN